MESFIITHEAGLRLGFFAGVLLLVGLVEIFLPRRTLGTSKPVRWAGNLGMVVLSAVLVRLVLPVTAVDLAARATERGWGVLPVLGLPPWLTVAAAMVALDAIIYLQHVLFHAAPNLWRLHMVHHADLDYDLTTGVRFHPIEILISMGIKFGAIVLLGAPAVAVVLFEILLNASAMFNHGNFRLPLALDRVLRLLLVTPDMHRVHHSVFPNETNKNFGFCLPWWDRLFGTYQAQPRLGHEGMSIGLNQFRDASRLTLPWLLVLPFVGKQGAYAIGRRGTRDEGEAEEGQGKRQSAEKRQ